MQEDRQNSRLNDEMKRLLAKQEITEALYMYCRSMDRNDRQLGKRVWHPDGTADYPPYFKGTGADFVDMGCNVHETKLDSHSHQISNILIVVRDNAAGSEAYVTCAQRFREKDQIKEMTIRGRYLDDWSYRDGRWAIDARIYVQDFCDVRDITHDFIYAESPTRARRNPDDPSYVTLRGL